MNAGEVLKKIADFARSATKDELVAASFTAIITEKIIQAIISARGNVKPGSYFTEIVDHPSAPVQELIIQSFRKVGWEIRFSGRQIALEGGCTMTVMKA